MGNEGDKNEWHCDPNHYERLKRCSEQKNMEEWNHWREMNPNSEIWLQKADFQHFILTGANFRKTHCEGANFSDAHCEGANFNSARCEGAKFTRGNCKNVNFLRAHCEGVDFSDARCEGANFKSAHCEGAKFIRANCEKANFIRAHCEGVVFSDARCVGADFYIAYCEWTNFRKAHCDGADFSDAHCEEADFADAHCKKATFIKAHCKGTTFIRAHCEEAKFIRARCERADFSGARCDGADFSGARCNGADFSGAHCDGADFSDAHCKKANFIKAHCKGANFSDAYCEKANFSSAHCEGANFTKASLLSTQFIKAFVNTESVYRKCEIDDRADFSNAGLSSVMIELRKKAKLEQNIRRMRWEKWCELKKRATLKRLVKKTWFAWLRKHPMSPKGLAGLFALLCLVPVLSVRFFWYVSDYGHSTTRIICWFLYFIGFFAVLYTLFPSILNFTNGDVLTLQGFWNYVAHFMQMFAFAASTMVTLGFSIITVVIAQNQPHFLGMLAVTINLMVSYFMLAVLVTRLSILFQTLGPRHVVSPSKRKQ